MYEYSAAAAAFEALVPPLDGQKLRFILHFGDTPAGLADCQGRLF